MIASDSTFAPFEFQNAQGDYVGIDVDLVKRATELVLLLNLNLLVLVLLSKLLNLVKQMGWLRMTITDDRKSLRLLCSLL